MKTTSVWPFYAKASLSLIGLYIFVNILSVAQDIILPLIYAILVAISISPVVNFLVKKGIYRGVSIAAVLAVFLLAFVALVAFLSSQANMLGAGWPKLAAKFQDLFQDSIHWASGYFGVSEQYINTWLMDAKNNIYKNSNSAIGITLTTMGGIVATTMLTPVYIFMLLFYQPHLTEFVHRLFGSHNNNKVNDILVETKTIVKSYLVGLFIEFSIVSALNTIGLLIIGIDYAILLGVAGALLNIIPYLGGLIAVAVFMIIALVTKSPVYLIYVGAMYMVIQFVDNNYIVPKIIGSKVKINALVSILAVITGAALWGIPGMFLSIPLTAILKLILDRIESLKPWGFLLGDTTPPILKLKQIFK